MAPVTWGATTPRNSRACPASSSRRWSTPTRARAKISGFQEGPGRRRGGGDRRADRPASRSGARVPRERACTCWSRSRSPPRSSEADDLVNLASKKKAVLQVGHVQRYSNAFKALAKRVDSALYIDAERLAGFKQRGAEVDVILDLMIHDLDLALSLARAEVSGVSACGFRVLTKRHRHRHRAHRVRQRLRRRPVGEPREPGGGAQVPRVRARPLRLRRPAGRQAALREAGGRRDQGDRGDARRWRRARGPGRKLRSCGYQESACSRSTAPRAGACSSSRWRSDAWCASAWRASPDEQARSRWWTRRANTARSKPRSTPRSPACSASGRFVLGPEGEALEREIAQFVGASHAVGCNSGTDALHLPLVAAGIGPGDEVVIPGFTFFATGEAVSYTGATPVFADVEEGTFNLDPASLCKSIIARRRRRSSRSTCSGNAPTSTTSRASARRKSFSWSKTARSASAPTTRASARGAGAISAASRSIRPRTSARSATPG